MAQAGTFQFGVDESFLSQSVSRALINGTRMAQKSGALTPGINEQAFRQPLGRITGDINKFQSSLAAANQRVIAFGASATVFYGISTALKGLVTSTLQVNKSMVDINSIFGLSTANLGKFKNELFDVARKTSQSFNVVAESAKEFSRQGLSVEETLKRVRDSMILTRLTGLSAADAANTLTAAMNSFNKQGLDTTQILNKMVAADSAFAVSSKDLADALTRVGSTAQDAGVQFEELLALVTSVKQITGREGAVIANGFKTIFNREERSTTIEMLEKLGVAVRDQNSNILPTIQILKNLAMQYDELGVSQKQQVAQMMGGVYQMNTLKAVMSDLSKQNSIYDQALRQIGKSQDEAIKRNEYLNTSFSAMVQRAQDTFAQIGDNLGEKIFSSNTSSLQSAVKNLFGKENFDNFLDGLKGIDSEGVGNTIGQGLIKGLGNVFGVSGGIPGPGLLAIGVGITKVLSTSIGMAIKDAQSLLGVNQKIQNINVGVERAILGANDAEKQRLMTAKTLAQQEAVILDILLRQNAAMAQMKAERNALQVSIVSNNPKLAAQAIKMAKTTPTGASGFLPAIIEESRAISKGVGGASPSAKPVVIPNFNFGGGKTGPIVANTDEYLVPNYAGKGSAIFNKEMVAKSGVPSGAVRVAAGGFSPINIENQYGRLFGELSNSGQFTVSGITTAQKGMGYSNKLYAELVGLLGEKGAHSIFGKLVPQETFNNPNIKAVLPQLTRGKHGRSNLLRMFGEDDQFGPAINFRGGSNFDTDLGNSAGRILRMMQQGYGATEFTTFLANGYVPNFARPAKFTDERSQLIDFLAHLHKKSFLQLNESRLRRGEDQVKYANFLYSSPGDSLSDEKYKAMMALPQQFRDPEYLTDVAKSQLLAELNAGLLSEEYPLYSKKILGKAYGYIPNFARRGRPSIKGRQIRYEGDMDFSSVLGPEGLMQLFTIFGFGLGNHPTKSTIDRRSLEKFGISIPEGLTPGSKFPYRGAANGLIPKSISNAISREIKAGAPLSSIYLDKDSRLISKDNPMGLLVANRRDEPSGGFEGVNRYQEMGLNPKLAGNHIPNFADPAELLQKQIQRFLSKGIAVSSVDDPIGTQKQISKEVSKLIKNIDLKSVDFTSSNFVSQITKKVKDSIQASFQGIDFGKTSAFSKITDQIIETREREIRGLQNYQIAIKKSNIENEKRIEDEKKKGLYNIGSKIFGGTNNLLSRNELVRRSTDFQTTQNIEWSSSQLATQINRQASIQVETLNAIKRQAAANTIQQKLSSGQKFQDLTGLEQITLRKQYQQDAYRSLGYSGTGASMSQIMRNKEAREQISAYVNQQIATISQNNIPIPPQTAWSKWKGRMSSPMGQMAMMIGPSMVSGFIPEGQGGTAGGRALGGVQGALQGMGTGAMFGPWGAVIGAGVGGLAGVASKWNKSFDEIGRDIEEANTKNRKVVNDISLYIQQTGEITEAINEGLSPKRVKELVDKQVKLFTTFEDTDIRRDILSGKAEDAYRKAQEKQLREQNVGDIISSFARGSDEVSSFTRWAGKLADAIGPEFEKKYQEASLGQGDVTGLISIKNLEIASKSFLNIMDNFNAEDLERFSKELNSGPIVALQKFSKQLGLSEQNIKQIDEESTESELNFSLRRAISQRGNQLNIQKEFGGNIEDLMKRFQISNLQWQDVGFQTQLNANRINIAGQSGLRTRNLLNTARLDLNPDLTETARAEMLGQDQFANLQALNKLNFFGAVQSARTGLSTIAQQSTSVVGPEQILKMNEMFKSIAESGDISILEKQLNELTELQKATFDTAEDSKSNDKQFHGASIGYLREQYQKLDDLLRSSKAAEEELKIQNSLNTIRIKEGQRQNLMNNANYSVDIFAQARRNREAAEGLPFTRGPYREGLTLQAKINEQDYLSSLGIVQSSDSLSNYNRLKQSRTQATIATLLQQETGQKVNQYDINALRQASSKSANASRYKETIDLFGFSAQEEISKLATRTGASYNEIVNKLMKTGADPLQSTIAMNTGKTAEVSTTINSNMVDGFSRIESLWQAAITSNKGAEIIKSAVGEKMGIYGEKRSLENERLERLKSNKPTEDLDVKIKDAEYRYEIADKKLTDLLSKQKVIASPSTSIGAATEKQQISKISNNITPSDPFLVTDSNKEKEKIDEITNSLKGLKQGLIDANTEWGTFQQLGEETGKKLSSAAGEAFGAFVTGSMKGSDAFRSFAASVLSDIAKMYAQKAMSGLISGLFGGGGGGGGGGGLISGLFSSKNTGGSILKLATGGQVPALLTGGEYYFTPSAAKAIGQNNLNAINSGTARFAGGGLVRGGSGYMDDVPATLDDGGFVIKRSAVQKYGSNNLAALARNLGGEVRMYASGGNVSPAMGVGGSSSGAGGNTNVKIELHDNRTSASTSSDSSASDPEFNKRLSMAIKSSVLQTINEQRRIGGTLRQSQNY